MAKAGSRTRVTPRGRARAASTPRGTEDVCDAEEGLFRTLTETTAAITFIHRDDRLLYVNRAAREVTGHSREQLLGMRFWDIVHPSMREAARERSRARLRGEAVPSRTELKIVTRAGEARWVEFTAATIHYRGQQAVLGTAFDITDRKRADVALRRSEKRSRALIEHSSDLVTLVAADGGILYVSPNVGRILGYDAGELVGRNSLDLVHPHDVGSLAAMLPDLLARPNGTATALYRCRHKNGTWRWMEAVGTNVLGELDEGAVVVNKRDVTDRHRAEEEARQHRIELAHALRLGSVGEVAAGVAHEINQPLAAIVNYARGALRRLERGRADVSKALVEIAELALRAGEIVRGLKRFVRKEQPQWGPVDLNALATHVLRLVQNEARHLGVELRAELAGTLPRLRGDAIQLEQVIFNLVRNGLDAIRRTGPPGTVTVRTASPGDACVELTVSDSGGGIADQHRARIFEPFFTTRPDGLGMGLAISRSIVEAHGGRIWADENHGHGAVVRATLPLEPEDEAAMFGAAGRARRV
jgi:two-component system sensor kinase FixL